MNKLRAGFSPVAPCLLQHLFLLLCVFPPRWKDVLARWSKSAWILLIPFPLGAWNSAVNASATSAGPSHTIDAAGSGLPPSSLFPVGWQTRGACLRLFSSRFNPMAHGAWSVCRETISPKRSYVHQSLCSSAPSTSLLGSTTGFSRNIV